jgi:acetyl-CoA carboxylase biotin carboxyl carrier protein
LGYIDTRSFCPPGEAARLVGMAKVAAPLTGTVWKIQVKAGDTVEEGQVLVILESMKMEMPVEAPEAGKVGAVNVSEGQAVEEGDVLVSLE